LCRCAERSSIPEHRQDGNDEEYVRPNGTKPEPPFRFLYWE
jgi:hypothetical protein